MKTISCKDCKFWDKDPESSEPSIGTCLRTISFNDLETDESSAAISGSELGIERIYDPDDEQDVIGCFVDGSPFDELLARRFSLNLAKISTTSWLQTEGTFSCNQARSKRSKCEENCIHCTFYAEE